MKPILMVCLNIVRDGTFDEFTGGESIDEVFTAFFEQPNWDAQLVEGHHCVTFTGRACYDDKETDYLFVFDVTPKANDFTLEGVEVDGRILSDPDIDDLLDDIYYAFDGSELPPAKLSPDLTPEELEMELSDSEDLVRTGSFDGFPDIPCEDILDDFFADGTFHALVGEDDALYVNYTGVADYKGARSAFVFQFAIASDRDSFEVASLEINGVTQPDQTLDAVLLDILKSYRG